MSVNELAGKPAPPEILVDVARLVSAYYTGAPDPSEPAQRISFGTSGHRGSSLQSGFNENHILAVTQAICNYRKQQGITGPLYLGADTHALSVPATATALEVLAANEVEVMISNNDEYTPTPAVSHAILCYNRGRESGLSDGIVITPSHNPPESGGFKYNPPSGGPADTGITNKVEAAANRLLEEGLREVRRMPHARALRSTNTHRHDYLNTYVADLETVIDIECIRGAGLSLGVNPLGGSGVHYWPAIAAHYKLNLEVVNNTVDPTFRFMTVDWDGRIRMDPSSPWAMQGFLQLKDRFDVAFACDTDHDRHGVITRGAGLMQPNHYLSTMVWQLFSRRRNWSPNAAVGKTLVSSRMIDRVALKLGRRVHETPVGFKWFVDGLLDGSLGFGGEESAGASFLRRDGSVWTTDKDGIIAALLAAEITAGSGKDPATVYQELTNDLGDPVYQRIDAPATPEQKLLLAKLSPTQVTETQLAGEKITNILTRAPGNNAPIGGLKVETENGWFAARPSGTEDIYKIYAESFQGEDHLQRIIAEAQTIVGEALYAR